MTPSGRVVRRLMAEEGCGVACGKGRRGCSSYPGEASEAPANLVRRDFHAAAPNRLWLTDITGFHVDAAKACLSAAVDCFDGAPVSWAIGTSPNAELANAMCWKTLAKGCQQATPRWHTAIGDVTTDGQDGQEHAVRTDRSGRCRKRDALPTTPHARVSSEGPRTSSSITAIGAT